MSDITKGFGAKSTNVRKFNPRRLSMQLLLGLSGRIFPEQTQRFIHRQFFAPHCRPPGPEQIAALERAQRFSVKVNEQAVRCFSWGSGPAIVLVHGWDGRGAQFHRFIEPIVQAGHRAVAFDGPGHGESDGRTCSYFEMTDAVRTLIRTLGVEQVRGLVGHSFGAGAIVNALDKERLDRPAVLIAPALGLRRMIRQGFEYHGIPTLVYEPIISDYERRFSYQLAQDDPFVLLGQGKISALIVHDVLDRVIPIATSRAAANSAATVKLHETSQLGHRQILVDDDVIRTSTAYLLGNDDRLAAARGVKH